MIHVMEIMKKVKKLLTGKWSFDDVKYGRTIEFTATGKFILTDENRRLIPGDYNLVQEGTNIMIYLNTMPGDRPSLGPLIVERFIDGKEFICSNLGNNDIRLLKTANLRDCVREGCEIIDFYYREIEEAEIKRALDLGYGEGHIVSYLLEKGYNVLGIDNRKGIDQVLKNALDEAGIYWVGKLDLREQDVAEFDSDQKFSCIIASHILHFLEYPQVEILIKKLKEALVPKGIILIRVHEFDHPQRKNPKTTAKHFFTDNEIEALFMGENYVKLLKRRHEAISSVHYPDDREVCLEYVFQKQ